MWSLPAASAKRAPSIPPAADPNLRAVFALARQAEAQDPVWVSTELGPDDIFSMAEETVLRDLPPVTLAKKEADFEATKRALQEAAAWVVQRPPIASAASS